MVSRCHLFRKSSEAFLERRVNRSPILLVHSLQRFVQTGGARNVFSILGKGRKCIILILQTIHLQRSPKGQLKDELDQLPGIIPSLLLQNLAYL